MTYDHPPVYVGIEEGETVSLSCGLARCIMAGGYHGTELCCTAANCLCASDSQTFRPATDEEAQAFWKWVDMEAGYAIACAQNDW